MKDTRHEYRVVWTFDGWSTSSIMEYDDADDARKFVNLLSKTASVLESPSTDFMVYVTKEVVMNLNEFLKGSNTSLASYIHAPNGLKIGGLDVVYLDYNEFDADAKEEVLEALKKGCAVQVGSHCIGHTRAEMVRSACEAYMFRIGAEKVFNTDSEFNTYWILPEWVEVVV